VRAALIRGLEGQSLWIVEADSCDSKRTMQKFIGEYGNGCLGQFMIFIKIQNDLIEEGQREKIDTVINSISNTIFLHINTRI